MSLVAGPNDVDVIPENTTGDLPPGERVLAVTPPVARADRCRCCHSEEAFRYESLTSSDSLWVLSLFIRANIYFYIS